jgi:hypothetical protein
MGFGEVLQQTPRSVIFALPSLVILPPLWAELKLILVPGFVDNIGSTAPRRQRIELPPSL